MSILLTVPAIVALTNLAKRTGLRSRLAPLVSVLAGVAVACGDAYSTGSGYLDAVARGIVLGLTASGLYDLMPGEPKRTTVNVYGRDTRGKHSEAPAQTPEAEAEAEESGAAPTAQLQPVRDESRLDPGAAAAAHVAQLPPPAAAPTSARGGAE